MFSGRVLLITFMFAFFIVSADESASLLVRVAFHGAREITTIERAGKIGSVSRYVV